MVLTIVYVLLAGTAAAPEGRAPCDPAARLVQWPSAERPIWSLCVLRPAESSGAAGSGLEIRNAFFNGRRVLRSAGVPVVNVFHANGCGCSRGVTRGEASFEVIGSAGPVSSSAAASAEALVPPRTVCEAGAERGAFRGVAEERLPDRLVLTSAMASGSERYTMSWTFRLDGTIEPRFSFASLPSRCALESQVHHAYWRFELDVSAEPGTQRREEMRQVGAGRKPALGVRDPASGRGYVLIPGPEALDLPADADAAGDVWLLRAKDDEPGDTGKDCRIDLSRVLNGEEVPEGHAALWYRGGAYHSSDGAGACDTVGPTLQPFGDWSRPTSAGP
jgi:hypothetical protein